MTIQHSQSDIEEAARWGYTDVAKWKDAMKRSGILRDMGYSEAEVEAELEERGE